MAASAEELVALELELLVYVVVVQLLPLHTLLHLATSSLCLGPLCQCSVRIRNTDYLEQPKFYTGWLLWFF